MDLANKVKELENKYYRINSKRPLFDPCGTPLSTMWGLDLKPSTTATDPKRSVAAVGRIIKNNGKQLI